MSAPGLFDNSLIPASITASLPETYKARALEKGDFAKGFLDVLRGLTNVGDISEDAWNARYDWMATNGRGTYFVLVLEDGNGNIIATGAVIVERKFIHNLGLVGHIEDISVATNQQGKKLGIKVIQALDQIAQSQGCYKTILDCSEKNVGFYEKCGYKRTGVEMAHYYEKVHDEFMG